MELVYRTIVATVQITYTSQWNNMHSILHNVFCSTYILTLKVVHSSSFNAVFSCAGAPANNW